MLDDTVLWSAFSAFDADNSGKLSHDEIAKVLALDEVEHVCGRQGVTTEQVAEYVREMDTNGDGEVDFDEFCAFMKKQQE